MGKDFKSIVATLFLIPNIVWAISPRELAIEALKNNKELLGTKNDTLSSEQEFKSSIGKFLPQINLESKYTKMNDNIDIDLNDIRTAIISSNAGTANILKNGGAVGAATASAVTKTLNTALPDFTKSIQQESFWNMSISVNQPIFTGGKLLANFNSKKTNQQISELNLNQAKDKIIADTLSAAFRSILLENAVSIRKTIAENIKKLDLKSDNLLKVGIITEIQKMKTEIALNEAEREILKTQNDLKLNNMYLENLISKNVNSSEITNEDLTKYEKKYEKINIENTNKTLLNLQKKQELVQSKKLSNNSNFLPTIGAFAKYEIEKKYLTTLEPQWAVGLYAKFNLFSGLSDYYDRQATIYTAEALENYTEYAKTMINLEIQKNKQEILNKKSELYSIELSQKQADKNLKLTKESFDTGTANITDLVDAEILIGKTNLEEAKIKYDINFAIINYLKTAGTIESILEDKHE